ncbi:MAG: hypothetical protein C4617_03585 [Candidatus Liberibacter europaeus]|uniref:Uncharacterized protein n=1 Tax=Candidatus Liberibacter europaeus TaxID=744859 RepID=A0A2T4VX08_9HYPH|nr:hypothetical protein [Candidatus Liberibacter europaeus]PTL86306.1 MAG: hypothetical protein C4617_03585 [Candidatus Liberibacter europaeus]
MTSLKGYNSWIILSIIYNLFYNSDILEDEEATLVLVDVISPYNIEKPPTKMADSDIVLLLIKPRNAGINRLAISSKII